MVPGDIIEWHYDNTHKRVLWDEQLLLEGAEWANIGCALVHVLVAIGGGKMTWVNSEGTFTTSTEFYGRTICPDTLDEVSAYPCVVAGESKGKE